VSLEFEEVTVRAGGHAVLEEVSVRVAAGEQVAIVGASGSGKSSFVGTLLGWHRPSAGRLICDGQPLEGEVLGTLRQQSAWVDPEIQIWNRSVLENLTYGNGQAAASEAWRAIELGRMRGLLERLKDGLQTSLGEGGGLVSGGEGERVRLGRALLRRGVRLVILDEAFRGLDREQRRTLLEEARRYWARATLLCVTHDVSETRGFSRVLVFADGRLVEDGPPDELADREGSVYRALLEADGAVRDGLFGRERWRRLWFQDGQLADRDRDRDRDRAGDGHVPGPGEP
jgi:ATP-binding cassette subfamily B protein